MAPRPGGESDKLGNKYELAWAIRHALYCIDDDHRSLTLEDVDPELGEGSEFTYDTGVVTEVHQLKRQNGNRNSWTVKTLADHGIFAAAASHVEAGRHYKFVSLVPSMPLMELSDRARKSADLASFVATWLTEELRSIFDQLSASEVLGSAQGAWTTLRGMWFSVQSEHDIIRLNSMLAELQLSGSRGHLTSLAIGDILLEHLGERLTRTRLLDLLAKQDIRPVTSGLNQTALEQVRMITASWRDSIQRELLQPPLERAEAARVANTLALSRITLVTGSGGGGKSSVLEQAVSTMESGETEVLAIRLDRLDSFASTTELGSQLGVDTTPTVALALAAGDRRSCLVIDQLDAVSLASGRMPDRFDVVMDLIGEALSVAGMRVVLACREFDIDNDHRIRSLAARSDVEQVHVGSLSPEQVDVALTNMRLDPRGLTGSQRELLQMPLHLVLVNSLVAQGDALAFQSKDSLFEAFWTRKRQTSRARRGTVRFNEVISTVANAVSDRQVLSVPVEVLDNGDLIEDAHVLVSEHVLAREGDRIAFFHETFFDYAFARQWVSRSESLIDFLLRAEQELFRRAQVRQILQHLYERDPERFRDEVELVLTTTSIRFHIKETVLAVVASLPTPTTDDADLMLRVGTTSPNLKEQISQQLRRTQWFLRFFQDGEIARWLDSADEDVQERAINMMANAVKEHPAEVALTLDKRKSRPEYFEWLRWVVRFADLHLDRQLFDLVIEGVQRGAYDMAEHELWLTAHGLGKQQPLWAIELMQARLINHADTLLVNADRKVAVLGFSDYGVSELIKDAADSEPLAFVEVIVPYLRQVMAVTAFEPYEDYPIRDQHFSVRFAIEERHDHEIGDALMIASVRSLETLAQTAPEEVRSLLEDLATDPYDGSQFLLYRALAEGGMNFAHWSANLLLEGGGRLECGYVSDFHWAARELVTATAPYLEDEIHQRLEVLFRDLHNTYEDRRNRGRSAFIFLSALEQGRLTMEGERRLGEYQRKFDEDTPSKPEGIRGGFIGSPIDADAAALMTDAQWLKAFSKYSADETDWINFTGGARELSQVLGKQVEADPTRFARLALELNAEYNDAYAGAFLMGFGNAEVREGTAPLIFDAVRHIASLDQAQNDRWFGTALQKYSREAPLDLVEFVLDRALHAPNPMDNSPVIVRSGTDGYSAADMHMNGLNTARGSLAEALGDLLITDSTGQRTALVAPLLNRLASDPVLSVRSCVAHTLAASLRHARSDVISAFETLIDADDRLLAAGFVEQLVLYIGNVNPEKVAPVIQRMLISDEAEARETGGRVAAFAALEWNRTAHMTQAMKGDAIVRKGVATVCATRLSRTSDVELASATLIRLVTDHDDRVRKATADIALHLRGQALRPFAEILSALIDSPVYRDAVPQLLITLGDAPDKIDELILHAAQRFIAVFGEEANDLRTAAAGDAHYISKLVVRGLAQSQNRRERSALLDVLDELLEVGAYGINEAITDSERS